jgi:hypothetical protein
MTRTDPHPSATLAAFASALNFDDIPASVVRRAEDLMLDWVGSARAGKGARAVEAIERFARTMGPAGGPSEVLISRRRTTPVFAAMVNAAASHVAEQDDVHNGAVFHPGAVVFPPALAVAQSLGSSGRELLTAAVAGYEVGIRVGEFLGRSHYRVFHTTGTAGTVAAAAAGRLPALIEHGALRGDLQIQTDWTDGADSIEAMVHAAKAAGLEYVAITDHTRGLAMTGGCDEAKLRSQRDAIVALRERVRGIRVLCGAEVNIDRDGGLDIDDETLATLDVVGIAVHSHFGLSRREMT